ncbi:uncharacterized protein LOC143082025 [Mytilus galloprovincialis]|uniref:uncharacterized protein LOC143082025 n=1 Tax=Mytilus galloprovincialis TaxID=29158 RepID=UPI003F7B78CD
MSWRKNHQYAYRMEANVNNIDLKKTMNMTKFLLLVIGMTSGIRAHSLCSINICLRWTARQDILTIICKIDRLYLPVYIYNNFGKEIARCSIPFPSPLCTPTHNNIIVQQNAKTNETIVKVRRNIDRSINGNWSCRHGYGVSKYEANIEINIPSSKGHNKTEKTDEFRCLKLISLHIVTGVIISVVVVGICLIITWKCIEREGQHFKRIVSFLEKIDDIFGAKKCDEHLVKHKKIGFFVSFVFLVFGAGVVIGLLEKDSCTGSIVFLILGMLLCLTLLILFLRSQGDGRETQLCLRRADDSSGSRTPVLCDVNDEEAHHSDDAIESVSGEEQSLNDNGTCDIKVLDSYKEGTNSNGHGGAANFDTERTSDFDSENIPLKGS